MMIHFSRRNFFDPDAGAFPGQTIIGGKFIAINIMLFFTLKKIGNVNLLLIISHNQGGYGLNSAATEARTASSFKKSGCQ